MFFVVFGIMTIGPHIGHWVAGHSDIPYFLPHLWPYIHWVITVSFTIAAVETLYFMAPDVKQRFLATLPGATVAVIAWVALTYLMGVYFRSFAHFGNTYGILGATVAIMVWLYWTGFVLLLGAQFNSELERVRDNSALRSSKASIGPGAKSGSVS